MDVDVPEAVLAAARAVVGEPRRGENLGGLSGRRVVALHGDGATVVVKGPAPAAEVAVMRDLAPGLARLGVRTPRLHAVVEAEGPWLLMEHLPDPLPQERWGADPEVLAVLRRLHAAPVEPVLALPGRYRPRWDRDLTDAATRALALDGATSDRLDRLASRSAALFEPRGVVSGDPNPRNWRLAPDGAPVLLDLERVTVASPAVDLAILLPGLPDRRAAEAVVAGYGAAAPRVEDVLLAKAWTVVELAAAAETGSDAHEVVTTFREPFLTWLAAVPA